METNGQGIGNSHEVALTIALHVVFLVADVEHHLAGLGSCDTEISTTFLINLGELVTRNGCLGNESIGRNLNLLRHLDIGALGLVTQMTGYSLAITAT